MISKRDTKKSRSTTVVDLVNDPQIHYPGKNGLKVAFTFSSIDGQDIPFDPQVFNITMSKCML